MRDEDVLYEQIYESDNTSQAARAHKARAG